jgi:tetratricopeptide (TPR) repeat protein
MSTSVRGWLALFTLLAAAVSPLQAQDGFAADHPKPFVPLRPETQADRDHRESLKHYALALLCQREDRLIEALSALEMAARLDPKAAPVQQALIPMYLALERAADALAATRKALELDPDSYETWYLYARQLRARGDFKEAAEALVKALACSEINERPDLAHQLHYDLGVLHERAGETEKAAAAFSEAVKLLEHTDAPQEQAVLRAAETHERVGRIWVQARKFDRAVAAFRKAQEVYPAGGGRLNFNLAQVCQEQGKHADALGYIEAYLKEQPQGTEAYELKAALLGRLGRSAEVVPWLEKAAEADRYNVRLKMLLARQYAEARLADKAETAYTDLAAQAPAPELYQGLFRLYRAEPKLGMGKALTLFDRTFAAARDRQNPAQGLSLAQARAMLLALRDDVELTKALLAAAGVLGEKAKLEAETLQSLATLAERDGQLEQAERYFRGALRVTRGSDEEGKPILYAGLLKVLWKLRKYAEVAEVCRDALRSARDADCVVFQSELARALTRLERYEEALRVADSAVTLANATDRLGAQVLRLRILTQAGFYDRAEKECLGLLRDHVLPGEILELRYVLSGVYSAARQLDKAEEQLNECLKLDPDNATLNNDLGYIWADQNKNLDRAEELIRKAIELERRSRKGPLAVPGGAAGDEPDNAAYIDSLGWVLYRRGDLRGARRELERASHLPDGDDPVIWEHLGDVYLRLELRGPARAAFQRAAHFYERDRRGKMDGRYNELQQKLKLLGASAQP